MNIRVSTVGSSDPPISLLLLSVWPIDLENGAPPHVPGTGPEVDPHRPQGPPLQRTYPAWRLGSYFSHFPLFPSLGSSEIASFSPDASISDVIS